MTRLGSAAGIAGGPPARAPLGAGTLALALAVLAVAPAAAAQTLPARLRGVTGDADVRFASRPGVCGDGAEMISLHEDAERRLEERATRRDERPCLPGPVRLRVTVAGGAVTELRAHVGGTTPSGVADLGTVSASDAGAWLLSLARGADEHVARRAIFVMLLADSVDVTPPFVAITTDRSRPTRVRESAVFWLGQVDDPRASAALRDLALRADMDEPVRGQAVFVLGQRDDHPEDIAFLREHFAALPERLRGRALMGIAQHGGADGERWLLALVADSSGTLETRRQALFWAGQGGTPTATLAALYGHLHDAAMQKQLLFVLSQRSDSIATEQLIDIARRATDHDLRRQAMFWLGQRHDDPRAAAFIASVLEQ